MVPILRWRGRGLIVISPMAIAMPLMSGGQPIGADLPEDEDDGAPKPLPERLVMELTAHRTLALREAIGRSPDVALTLLLLEDPAHGAGGCCGAGN